MSRVEVRRPAGNPRADVTSAFRNNRESAFQRACWCGDWAGWVTLQGPSLTQARVSLSSRGPGCQRRLDVCGRKASGPLGNEFLSTNCPQFTHLDDTCGHLQLSHSIRWSPIIPVLPCPAVTSVWPLSRVLAAGSVIAGGLGVTPREAVVFHVSDPGTRARGRRFKDTLPSTHEEWAVHLRFDSPPGPHSSPRTPRRGTSGFGIWGGNARISLICDPSSWQYLSVHPTCSSVGCCLHVLPVSLGLLRVMSFRDTFPLGTVGLPGIGRVAVLTASFSAGTSACSNQVAPAKGRREGSGCCPVPFAMSLDVGLCVALESVSAPFP